MSKPKRRLVAVVAVVLVVFAAAAASAAGQAVPVDSIGRALVAEVGLPSLVVGVPEADLGVVVLTNRQAEVNAFAVDLVRCLAEAVR